MITPPAFRYALRMCDYLGNARARPQLNDSSRLGTLGDDHTREEHYSRTLHPRKSGEYAAVLQGAQNMLPSPSLSHTAVRPAAVDTITA